jgi:major membrane immunogen (membrane-anchored lipoprotein)
MERTSRTDLPAATSWESSGRKPTPSKALHARVVLAVVLLTGCGASDDGVASFDLIGVSGPDVEIDPSGTAAILTVETSIDAVCAVSYGIEAPAGNIATDREMDPEGHTEHRVVLSGLQPETEYAYRLQGVASDGRLYRSDVFTFRTPTRAGSPLGPNLAEQATVVDVSSEFSSGFAASNAIDGDPGTEWSSRGDGDGAFITIDLGDEVEVSAVVFRTREMTDETAITSTFTVTVDDTETYGPLPAGPEPVDVEFRGRVLRFDVAASTGGNTGAVELAVYGERG